MKKHTVWVVVQRTEVVEVEAEEGATESEIINRGREKVFKIMDHAEEIYDAWVIPG